MDRRLFLTTAVTGSLAGATAAFARGFQPVAEAGSDAEAELCRSAWVHARALGKPLLVLVVPADADRWYERGVLFGSWLNHASPLGLAELSLVEVVCVTEAALARAFPELRKSPDGEPLMWLLETDCTDCEAPAATALNASIEPTPGLFDGTPAERRLVVQANRLRIEALLRAHLAPHPSQLVARSRQALEALSREERAQLEATLEDGGTPPPALADRGAALVLAAALRHGNEPERNDALFGVLARAARERLLKGPPDGARWAKNTGCGTSIEGGDPTGEAMMIACGMGHVPKEARRFLYFYEKS